MRNLLIGIGIILVLLVGAMIVAPGLVGADQLTAFLSSRLKAATGYNVRIRGPVALSMLPSPKLSIDDIQVIGSGPEETELARAGSIEAHVALLPLIGGRVEVTAVTVRDPVVTVAGRLKAGQAAPEAPPSAEAAPATPSVPVGGKFSVDVRQIRVINGSFAYGDGGKTYRIDHLDFALTTGPDGAVSVSAETGLSGDAVHLQGRAGAIDCAQPVPLSLHATAAAGAAVLDFDGFVRCDGGQPPRTEGKLKLAADSLGAALAPFAARRLPPALDRPVTLDARLGADRTKLDLTDVRLDLDQTHGVGTLAARLADRPSIDLTLDVNRLDLDRWLATPATAAAPVGAPVPADVPRVAASPVAAPDLHIGLDLSAELLSWRGGLIRQARFNGGIDQGAITINQATAELPGGTDLAISGQVADAFAQPHFIGTIDAETDDLRAVLGWAGVRFGGIPADRLRQASLSTSLDLALDRAAASGIDLELDGSRFKGAANLMFGTRPAIGLRLAGDQLNLDAYLADAAPVTAAPATGVGGASAGGPVVVAALMPLLAANLDLTLDSLTWRGQLLKAVHLAGTIEDGAATVRDARIGDLGGGSVSLSGRWAGGLGPTASLSGQATASGPSAVPLLTLAGLGGRDTAGRLGAYRLALQVGGSPAALDLDGTLAVQNGHLAAKGRLDLGAGAPHFKGDLTVDHPEAARVLALLAPLYRPAGGTLGALALAVSLEASPDRTVIDHLSLAIGGQELDGIATLDQTSQPPTLDADLTASDLVLDPFLPTHEVAAIGQPVRYAALGDPGPLPGPWSRTRLDLGWLGLVDAHVKLAAASATLGRWQLDKPSLAVVLKGGTLGLDRLSGGLGSGTIEAHGRLGPAASGSVVALTLAGRDLDLKDLAQRLGSTALSAGTGRLDADVTAVGATQADLIAALHGTASLAARDGAVGGLDLLAIDDQLKGLKGPQDLVGVLQAIQGGGTTRFSTLTASATIAQGVVRSTDLHLTAEGGDLTGTATADLPAWTIDGQAQLALAARPDLPPLAMRFGGPLDRPEKRIDVKSLAAYVALKAVTAAPASPSQQQQKPAQALRDLLKGLASKPNP